MQRLLDEVVSAFDTMGGAIYVGEGEQRQVALATEGWNGDARMSAPLTTQGKQTGLVSLGARRNGLDYTDKDQQTLGEIAGVVGQALDVAEQEAR